MPIQAPPDDVHEVRVKFAYNGEVFITYIKPDTTYERLQEEVKEICKFSADQVFTVKWVDEEGDPCMISTQMELEEAIRLYEVNHEPELVIHVFPNVPPTPGMNCKGEDKSIYRRGDRR
uniref:Protein kinase C iota type n=1 Tax=Cacopsylla melanoneura TaxID=428564 RepID=A0A8D8ZUK0_9HEMI